jgi:cytochrome c oxidase assembly protein subunit 15
MVGGTQAAYHRLTVRLPHFSPATVRKVALLSVVVYALLMVSGGAVRLTGSGLGCPDWPSCYQHHITAVSTFHPIIEFGNRLVTVAVTVLSGAALVVTLRRDPFPRDLALLGGGLVAGVVAQVVLGGLVVLFTLNPYLVALHFLLGLVVLADAVVFYHRSVTDPTPAEVLVTPTMRNLARLQLAALGLVTLLGTMVTGSGPHAGGPGAKRIDIAFRSMAEAHSAMALFLIGLTLAAQFAFFQAGVPEVVQKRGRWLIEMLALQGMLGYLQYTLHDNPIVVECHLAGVTSLWIIGIGFYLSLHRHPPAVAPDEAPERRATVVAAS